MESTPTRPSDPRTDAMLIRDARRSPDAFRTLYDRHAAAIEAWLRRRTGDERVAFELTAETFAAAALSLRRFEDRAGGSAAPWLYGIAANHLRRYHGSRRIETAARRRLGIPPTQYVAEFDEVEERDSTARLAPALRSAVDELPEGQQRALELRVVRELPYAEVGAELGCSPLAARIRVSRALDTLAQALKGVTQ